MRLEDIGLAIGADCTGDAGFEVTGVALPDSARSDQIAFLQDSRWLAQVKSLSAGAFLIGSEALVEDSRPRLVSPSPRLSFIRLLELFAPKPSYSAGVHPSVTVGRDCRIDPTASVMAGSVLGDGVEIAAGVVIYPVCFLGEGVQVGEGSVLHSNVSVGWGCRIGPRCILFPGAVLGADGFGHHVEDGRHYRYPHLGIVVLEEGVEVGANAAIDRATLGETQIGAGTKIDNLVQIAHNCQVGERCFIASQAGVGGSSIIGDRVTLAGQAGVSDHVRIGSGVTVLGQAGIYRSVAEGEVVGGTPALPKRLINEINSALPELPRMAARFQAESGGEAQKPSCGWRDEALEILASHLGVPSSGLEMDADLREEFEADSLTVLNIISEIESKFGMSMPDEDVHLLRTPEAILTYLEPRIEASAPESRD